MTRLRTGLAILLALLSAAPSVAQMARAATEELGCYAYLVYPPAPATTTDTARPSLSCEAGEGVISYDAAAGPNAELEEHSLIRADANLAEARVP